MALAERRGVVWSANRGEPASKNAHLAYPLIIDGQPRGVVALEAEGGGRSLRAAMRQLQWGTFALRDRLRREQVDSEQRIIDRRGRHAGGNGYAKRQYDRSFH